MKSSEEFKNRIAEILKLNGYKIQEYFIRNEIGAIATKEYETFVGKKESQVMLTLNNPNLEINHRISLVYHSERDIYSSELIPVNCTDSQLENIIKKFVVNSEELINKSYARSIYLNEVRRSNLENMNNYIVQFLDNKNGSLQEGIVIKSELDKSISGNSMFYYAIETKEKRHDDVPEGDISRIIYQNQEELNIHELIYSIKKVNPNYKIITAEELNLKFSKKLEDPNELTNKYIEFLKLELKSIENNSIKNEVNNDFENSPTK